MGIYMWHRIGRIPYETTFLKIKGKTNAEKLRALFI